MEDEAKKSLPLSWWEKVKIVGILLASVLIPVVLAIIGQSYTAAIKEKEIGVRYVELATNILDSEPRPKTTHLRKWAIDVISYYSEIPLPSEALTELEEERIGILQGTERLW